MSPKIVAHKPEDEDPQIRLPHQHPPTQTEVEEQSKGPKSKYRRIHTLLHAQRTASTKKRPAETYTSSHTSLHPQLQPETRTSPSLSLTHNNYYSHAYFAAPTRKGVGTNPQRHKRCSHPSRKEEMATHMYAYINTCTYPFFFAATIYKTFSSRHTQDVLTQTQGDK